MVDNMIKMSYTCIVKAQTQRQYYVRTNGRGPNYRFSICYINWSSTEHCGMKKILALCIAVSLSGCAANPTHHYRAKGEDWKFYPSVPGTAYIVAEQGRACWAETNRENWDQCQ